MQNQTASSSAVGGMMTANSGSPANIFDFCSADLSEFSKAFAAAQGKIKRALKDNTNPHFGSSYADLASVQEACMEALTSGGFSVVQPLIYHPEMKRTFLLTRLLHTSGQWMQSIVPIDDTKGAQAFGSFVTYMRRYSLAAIVGVASDDDDGNAASGGDGREQQRANKRRPDRERQEGTPQQEQQVDPRALMSREIRKPERAPDPTPEEVFERNKKAILAAKTPEEMPPKISGGKWMSDAQIAQLKALKAQCGAAFAEAEKQTIPESQEVPQQSAPNPPTTVDPKVLHAKAELLYQRLAQQNKDLADQLWRESSSDQEAIDNLHTELMKLDKQYASRHAATFEEAPIKTAHPEYPWDEQ